ncbi:MAG: histidinol-phosphatase [Rhodospirillaceae bacterium]|nr:histidinol-phosphatase [Rhodospirillaceae bacterium]
MTAKLSKLSKFAATLADISGPIVCEHFRTPLNVHSKSDRSPVTIVDRSVEAALRKRIEETFPHHGIIGEEYGPVREDASHIWVLDPIDGTKAFISGLPIFGTLIALAIDGQPVVGVIDQPVLGERWVGVKGYGAQFNEKPIQTRDCLHLADAALYATHPSMFDQGVDKVKFDGLANIVGQARFGGDCYAYGLLASGHIDLVVEAKLQFYDYMALIPVVEGAGGVISDWQGDSLGRGSDGHMLAAANEKLWDLALNHLRA